MTIFSLPIPEVEYKYNYQKQPDCFQLTQKRWLPDPVAACSGTNFVCFSNFLCNISKASSWASSKHAQVSHNNQT